MAERCDRKTEYFRDYMKYVKIIAQRIKYFLKDAKIIIFGSVVKGNFHKRSDIDILAISNQLPDSLQEQAKIKLEVLKDFDVHPFEIHLTTPQIYQNWFKNFIKNDYIVII